MSGGGGGSGGTGGGGGGGPSQDCSTLIFRTVLSSPKPAVVKKLSVNDRLSIDKRGDAGPAVAVTSGGEDAGSITSTKLGQMLACIDDGYKYEATVTKVNGGSVEVEVRPSASP